MKKGFLKPISILGFCTLITACDSETLVEDEKGPTLLDSLPIDSESRFKTDQNITLYLNGALSHIHLMLMHLFSCTHELDAY